MSHQTYPEGTDPNIIPWDVPYKTPPPGQSSNFDHPDTSLRNTIIITAAVTLAVAFFAFVARLGTRAFIVRVLGWDDYLCIGAVAIVVAFNVAALERIQYGLGIPTWDIRMRTYFEHLQTPFIYWFGTMNVLRHFGLMLLKLSILALYLRIMGDARDIHRKTRYVAIGAMVWVVGYNAGLLGWLLGLCNPPKKFFYPHTPGHCLYPSVWKELAAWSAMNVFTDFLIFVIPLPMVLRLQMPLSQKIGVVFTLATALMVCAATIVNMVITVRIIRQQSTEDPLQLWAIIEMNIGLICICLPALKQLLSRSIPILSKSFGSSRSYGSIWKRKESSAQIGPDMTQGERKRRETDVSTADIELTSEIQKHSELHEPMPEETGYCDHARSVDTSKVSVMEETVGFDKANNTELARSTYTPTQINSLYSGWN
ncbi:hypothetical protein ACLMJK_007791 [Lecanora helva]